MIRGLLALALPIAIVPAYAAAQIATFERFDYRGEQPNPTPPGHYRNPIIPGSYPDPSIVRVGRDYYLATSSFTAWPGIPIFHSRDLVRWTQIGHAVTRRDQMAIDGLDASWQGLYAPDLKYRDGRFYLLSTCYSCGGNFVMTAASAAGPWSKPTWLPFAGIDPSIFFDGRAYVLNNGPPRGTPRYDGHRAIWLQEIDLLTLTMRGERTMLVDGGVDLGTPPFWVEGRHLIKRDGRYILIAAQGGTKERHAQVVFAADQLRGPYRPGPNPILTQAGLDPARPDPVSSAGHADLVETPRGDWWAVFLANRPYGADDLLTNIGREVFLLPVAWRDGWPSILKSGEAVPLTAPRPRLSADAATPDGGNLFRDDFAKTRLGTQWTWLGTPREQWWRDGGGRLQFAAGADPIGAAGQPSFIGVRQRDANATVTVRVGFDAKREGDRAGLVAFADIRHFFALTLSIRADGGREVRLERRTGSSDPIHGQLVASALLPGAPSAKVDLRVNASSGAYRFAYAQTPGRWIELGGVQDGTILSIRATNGFVGTLIGMYAHRADAARPVERTDARPSLP